MKGIKLAALIGAIACMIPTASLAQTTATDSAYLNDLYSFLESEDETTYILATQGISPENNVWAAQMFCETFASGVSPADAYSTYTTATMSQISSYGGEYLTEDIAYAIGLYGGVVMNLGTAYYCPQYQPQVQQALRSLG
jgi:hypothetical protein